MEWKTNKIEARSGYLDIGRNFNAEVGFVPRVDIRKSDSSFFWRSRPKNPLVREFFPNARVQYVMDHDNRLLTRVTDLRLEGEFHNGGGFRVGRVATFERLVKVFEIGRQVRVAPGDYNFNHWYASVNSNPGARLSGQGEYERGSFWSGERRGVQLGLTWNPHYKFGLSTRYNWDKLEFRGIRSVSRLVTLRINQAFSTKMFLNALIQYNSDTRKVSSNVRFNLIHRPLSDIFIVYNEQRDAFSATQSQGRIGTRSRQLMNSPG